MVAECVWWGACMVKGMHDRKDGHCSKRYLCEKLKNLNQDGEGTYSIGPT